MVAIASISLLVGGIGIMNIMLASVLERTREIGVCRAIGARQSDIIRQFLIEAVLISFVGGVMGIAFGFGMSRMIALLASWSTIVTVSHRFSWHFWCRSQLDSFLAFIRGEGGPSRSSGSHSLRVVRRSNTL